MPVDRKILVTSALPYANGPLHMGHLVEYIQTDIWVRFQKLNGHTCLYVCADDAHGTAISLHAEKLGITPDELVARINVERQRDFGEFLVNFDCYHSTHSEENRALSELIYTRLDKAGHIARRTISQAFDPEKQMFLADRYIKGTCPKCKTPDQYGDNCEACGATYTPNDLIDPHSTLSGATPVSRDSEHHFFRLGDFEDFLKAWTRGGHTQPEIANKLAEWLNEGLHDWDISRDAPYFGFRIPGTEDKYFYVWLDAPIGYMASFRKLCELEGLDFDAWWAPGSDTEVYHFIGKDIINFHCLFWPAMLDGAGFRTPSAVWAHGFLTINGEKMSKSRGTFITARTYLDHLPAEALRYYFAAKLSHRIADIDLNIDDFVQKVNSDLVGKVINIASRTASFISKKFDGMLGETDPDPALTTKFVCAAERIAVLYEQRDFAQAMREIMQLADLSNQYIADAAPWVMAKDPEKLAAVQPVCTAALNHFRIIMTLLKPVTPTLSAKAEAFLNTTLDWSSLETPLLNHRINRFKPMMGRIEPEQARAILG
jgi:methionyl-tRNA synthetase